MIVPAAEWLAKIRAAAAARQDPDFAIIARTDANADMGFEEAVARSNAALAAGADIAFLEAPQTMDEVAAAPKRIKGPCLLNVVRGGNLHQDIFEIYPNTRRMNCAAVGGCTNSEVWPKPPEVF